MTVDSLRIDTAAWTAGRGYLGFRVPTGGAVDLYIGAETELYELPVPTAGRLRVTGVLDQRDTEAPLDAGYLLRPLTPADLALYLEPRITAVSETGCAGDAVTFTATTAAYPGSRGASTSGCADRRCWR